MRILALSSCRVACLLPLEPGKLFLLVLAHPSYTFSTTQYAAVLSCKDLARLALNRIYCHVCAACTRESEVHVSRPFLSCEGADYY